jgi:hypothetical protein
MPTILERISVLSHAVRTLLALLVACLSGAGIWYGYRAIDSGRRLDQALAAANDELQRAAQELELKSKQIESLESTVRQQREEIDRLDTAMRLLKVDHRVARLFVENQEHDPRTGELFSTIEFQELDDQGNPIGGRKQFRIPGDVVYIDSWVVKFDDKYVEQADLHRSTSLVLFRRIFGESQTPSQAFTLDEIGSRPSVYGRGGLMSDFERKIWEDFWSVANDSQRQLELGIRAAHGEAPSIKVERGKAYRITLRASGGLSVNVESRTEPDPAAPEA